MSTDSLRRRSRNVCRSSASSSLNAGLDSLSASSNSRCFASPVSVERDLLDAAVVRVGSALGQPERFEVVGEVRDIGRVAPHPLGGCSHRLRALKEVESVRLGGAEPEFLCRLLEVCVHAALDLEDSVEDLALGRAAHEKIVTQKKQWKK